MFISDLATKWLNAPTKIYSEDKEYASQNWAPKRHSWAEEEVLKSSELISSAWLYVITVDWCDVRYAQKLMDSKLTKCSTHRNDAVSYPLTKILYNSSGVYIFPTWQQRCPFKNTDLCILVTPTSMAPGAHLFRSTSCSLHTIRILKIKVHLSSKCSTASA